MSYNLQLSVLGVFGYPADVHLSRAVWRNLESPKSHAYWKWIDEIQYTDRHSLKTFAREES